jgi:hypothetical protein
MAMSNFEDYFRKYRPDIVDFIEGNIEREVKIEGGIIDTITNLSAKELPYGDGVNNVHRFLTLAVLCSCWSGWFSQARSNAGDQKMNPEYVRKFKEVIDMAYDLGKDYAQERT